MYAPNYSFKTHKAKTDRIAKRNRQTIVVGDFSNPFSVIDKTSR